MLTRNKDPARRRHPPFVGKSIINSSSSSSPFFGSFSSSSFSQTISIRLCLLFVYGASLLWIMPPWHQFDDNELLKTLFPTATNPPSETNAKNHDLDIDRPRIVAGRGARRPYSRHYCLQPRPLLRQVDNKNQPHSPPETTTGDDDKAFPHDLFRACHYQDVCVAPTDYAAWLLREAAGMSGSESVRTNHSFLPDEFNHPRYSWMAKLIYFMSEEEELNQVSDTDGSNANTQRLAQWQQFSKRHLRTSIRIHGAVSGPNVQHYEQYYQTGKPTFYQWPVVLPARTNLQRIWSPIPLAIPWTKYQGHNFGHVVGDNVFVLYRLLKYFGFFGHHSNRPDFVPLGWVDWKQKDATSNTLLSDLLDLFVFGTPNATQPERRRGQEPQEPTLLPPALHNGKIDRYYETIAGQAWKSSWRHGQPVRLDNDDTIKGPSPAKMPLLCFENVLSGQYFMSDHGEDSTQHGHQDNVVNTYWAGRADLLYQYRNDLLRRIGISPNVDLTVHGRTNKERRNKSILIIPRPPGSAKGGALKQTGWDHESLVRHLSSPSKGARRPGTNRTIDLNEEGIQVMAFSKLSTLQQIQMVTTAKVLISMGGGASYLSWFLPPGATLILLERDGKILDKTLYDHGLSYLRVVYIPEDEATFRQFVAKSFQRPRRAQFDEARIAREVHIGIRNYDESIENQ